MAVIPTQLHASLTCLHSVLAVVVVGTGLHEPRYGWALLDVGKMHTLSGGFGSTLRPELCQLSIDLSVWYLPVGLGINSLVGW